MSTPRFINYCLLLLWVFSGCSKADTINSTQDESTVITIDFINPLENEIIELGEECHVDAIINSNKIIGGWKLLIKNDSTETIITEKSEFIPLTQYIVHHHWLINQASLGTLTLRLTVFDLDDNIIGDESREVKCS